MLEEARSFAALSASAHRSLPGATRTPPLGYALSRADPEGAVLGALGSSVHAELQPPRQTRIIPMATFCDSSGAAVALREALQALGDVVGVSAPFRGVPEHEANAFAAAERRLRPVVPLIFSSSFRQTINSAQSVILTGSSVDAHGGAVILAVWLVIILARRGARDAARADLQAAQTRVAKSGGVGRSMYVRAGGEQAKLQAEVAKQKANLDKAEAALSRAPNILLVHDCLTLSSSSAGTATLSNIDALLLEFREKMGLTCVASTDVKILSRSSGADGGLALAAEPDGGAAESTTLSTRDKLSLVIGSGLQRVEHEQRRALLRVEVERSPLSKDASDRGLLSDTDSLRSVSVSSGDLVPTSPLDEAVAAAPLLVQTTPPSRDRGLTGVLRTESLPLLDDSFVWSSEVHARVIDCDGDVNVIAKTWEESPVARALVTAHAALDAARAACGIEEIAHSSSSFTDTADGSGVSRRRSSRALSDGSVAATHSSALTRHLSLQAIPAASQSSSPMPVSRPCMCGASLLVVAASRGFDDVLEVALGQTSRGVNAADCGLPRCDTWRALHKRDGCNLKEITNTPSALSRRVPHCLVYGFRMSPLMWACARGSERAVKAILAALEKAAACPCALISALISTNAHGADALSLAMGAPMLSTQGSASLPSLLFSSLKLATDGIARGLASSSGVPRVSLNCVCPDISLHMNRVTPLAWLLGDFDVFPSALRRPAGAPSSEVDGVLSQRGDHFGEPRAPKRSGVDGRARGLTRTATEMNAASFLSAAADSAQLSAALKRPTPLEIAARSGRAAAVIECLGTMPDTRADVASIVDNAQAKACTSAIFHRGIHLSLWNGHTSSALALINFVVASLGIPVIDPLPLEFSYAWGANKKVRILRDVSPAPVSCLSRDFRGGDETSWLALPRSHSSGRHMLDLVVSRWDVSSALALLSLTSQDGASCDDSAHRLLPSPAVATSPDWVAFAFRLVLSGRSAAPLSSRLFPASVLGAYHARRRRVPQSLLAVEDAAANALIAGASCIDGGWLVPPSERGPLAADIDDDVDNDDHQNIDDLDILEEVAARGDAGDWHRALERRAEFARGVFSAVGAAAHRLRQSNRTSCTNILLEPSSDAQRVPIPAYACLVCRRLVCAVCADLCHSTAATWGGCSSCGKRSVAHVVAIPPKEPGGAEFLYASVTAAEANAANRPGVGGGKPAVSALGHAAQKPAPPPLPGAPSALSPASSVSGGSFTVRPNLSATARSLEQPDVSSILTPPKLVRGGPSSLNASVSDGVLSPPPTANPLIVPARSAKLYVDEPPQPKVPTHRAPVSAAAPGHKHHRIVFVGFILNFVCKCEDGEGACFALPTGAAPPRELSARRWRPRALTSDALATTFPAPIAITQAALFRTVSVQTTDRQKPLAYLEIVLGACMHLAWMRKALTDRWTFDAAGPSILQIAATAAGVHNRVGAATRRTPSRAPQSSFSFAPAVDVTRRRISCDLTHWSALRESSSVAFTRFAMRCIALLRTGGANIEWTAAPTDVARVTDLHARVSAAVPAGSPPPTADDAGASLTALIGSSDSEEAPAWGARDKRPVNASELASVLAQALHAEWASRFYGTLRETAPVITPAVTWPEDEFPDVSARAVPFRYLTPAEREAYRPFAEPLSALLISVGIRVYVQPSQIPLDAEFVRSRVVSSASNAPLGASRALTTDADAQVADIRQRYARQIGHAVLCVAIRCNDPALILRAARFLRGIVGQPIVNDPVGRGGIVLSPSSSADTAGAAPPSIVSTARSNQVVHVTFGPYVPTRGGPFAALVREKSVFGELEGADGGGDGTPAMLSDAFTLGRLDPPTPLIAAIRGRRMRAVRTLLNFLSNTKDGDTVHTDDAPPISANTTSLSSVTGAGAALPSSTTAADAPLRKDQNNTKIHQHLRQMAQKIKDMKPSQLTLLQCVVRRHPADFLNVSMRSLLPLSIAAFIGARKLCERLVAADALPDAEDCAIKSDMIVFLEITRSNSSKPEAGKSYPQLTPLHFAVLAGHKDIVADFIAWGNKHRRYNKMTTAAKDPKKAEAEASRWSAHLVLALSIAVHRCHVDIVSLLIKERVSPLEFDAFYARPFYRALLRHKGRAGDVDFDDDRAIRVRASSAHARVDASGSVSPRPDSDDGKSVMTDNFAKTFADTYSSSGGGDGTGNLGSGGGGGYHPLSVLSRAASLPNAATGSIVSLLVSSNAVSAVLTWFALGIAAALFFAQVTFVILFSFASATNQATPSMSMLLYKQSLENSFANALDPTAGQENACTYLGWLAVNLCMQAAAASLASGNTSASSWSLSKAATCGGALLKLPVVDRCNVSAVAVSLAGLGQSARSRNAFSPLVFGSIASSGGSGATTSSLTQGSSLVVGAMRLTAETSTAAVSSSCAPWYMSGSPSGAWSSPLPASLQDPELPEMVVNERGVWGDQPCKSFSPRVYTDILSSQVDSRWYMPFAVDGKDSASLTPVTTTSTTVDISSDASSAPEAISSVLAAAFASGIPSLRGLRLDIALYEPSVNIFGALRIETRFPPFAASSSTVAARIAPLSGVPASLTGLATQLALISTFIVLNVRSFGTSSKMRWVLLDVTIPILALCIIGVRATSWVNHSWVRPEWDPTTASHSTYLDAWVVVNVVYTDSDLSAGVMLFAIFRVRILSSRAGRQTSSLN